MKKITTLHQKIAERDYKPMNPLLYWLYHFVMVNFSLSKYNPVIKRIDDIRKEKESCFIVFNHLSRLDHLYVLASVYPKPYNMMAAYNEFFRSHLEFVFRASKILPKKQFCPDIISIKAVKKIFSKGGSVAIAPEGIATMYGESHPISPGTGHLIKHFNKKVYFIELRGQHLTTSWTSPTERVGKTFATTRLLLDHSDIESMSEEEIDTLLNKVTRHNEYEWNSKEQIEFKRSDEVCDRLEDFLYTCPICGSEFTTLGKNKDFSCRECGHLFSYDNAFNMVSKHEGLKFLNQIE